MKFFSAKQIFTCSGQVLDKHVIVVEDDGRIKDIIGVDDIDSGMVEHHEGIITPGFINTHCHLELSHMKGKLETGTGLLSFIGNVVKQRGASEEEILDSIGNADQEMYDKGIVAVGDISNQVDTAAKKTKSKLRYYTFVEMFDFMQDHLTEPTIEQYSKVIQAFSNTDKDKVNFTPHAPYSVSKNLLSFIDQNTSPDNTFSVHNQETPPENELFEKGTGAFFEFYKSFDLSFDHFKSDGKSAIHYILNNFAKEKKLLFVHNTLTNEEDLKMAKEICRETYWASCPNANLYIENRLPDYKMFLDQNANVTIGTDSLTSNWQLSILEEIKTIKRYNSFVPLTDLIDWSCINGAKALGFDDDLGTIEKGKKPGIVNITAKLIEGREADISQAEAIRLI